MLKRKSCGGPAVILAGVWALRVQYGESFAAVSTGMSICCAVLQSVVSYESMGQLYNRKQRYLELYTSVEIEGPV